MTKSVTTTTRSAEVRGFPPLPPRGGVRSPPASFRSGRFAALDGPAVALAPGWISQYLVGFVEDVRNGSNVFRKIGHLRNQQSWRTERLLQLEKRTAHLVTGGVPMDAQHGEVVSLFDELEPRADAFTDGLRIERGRVGALFVVCGGNYTAVGGPGR